MLKNYFTTALRSIKRDGYYSFIKIGGLALGFGCSMVLLLFVAHQFSFDLHHHDVERTYRVNQSNIWDPDGGTFQSTGPAVAFALKNDYPEIQEIVRINTPGGGTVRYLKSNGELLAFNEDKVLAADSNFFSFFNFPLLEGDAKTALIGKNKVVISEEVALKIFGDQSALGKLIQFGDEPFALEVTGVTTKQAKNSHFNFDYLLSMATNPAMKDFEWSWVYTQVVTYVKVAPGADIELLKRKVATAPDTHARATFKRLGMDFDQFVRERGKWELYLQPLKEVHLHSARMGNRLGTTGNIQTVMVLGAVGIFILLIAVINFINLSTARAANRAKEVGVKKTLGWNRLSLITQFQVEHCLISILAMLLGLGTMELLRLAIVPLTGLDIPLTILADGKVIILLILLPVVVGFAAGLYPSFYLTSFRPAAVLKGKVSSGLRGSGLRSALVIFQFAISIALMSATVIIFKQLEFFRNRELGFNKSNLLIIDNAEKLGPQLESFRNEISGLEGVTSVSTSMNIRMGTEDLYMREGDDMKLPITQYKIDEHFFRTAELQLASGRSFDERKGDENRVIINETTSRLFGWSPEEALGEKIIYVGDDIGPQEIIGVVKDFHFQSLRQNIAPLMFFNIKSPMWGDNRILVIRYEATNAREIVDYLEKKWQRMADGIPFEYSFYDEELKQQYKEEERLGSLFMIFTILSISIAIIGLVGLASYSAEQRRKEIGIRKVFGASLSRIYVMLNRHYIKLMVISLLVATPLTWTLMQQWLDMFSYRIEIDPVVFVLAGLSELLIALVCVGYLAIRAASANPADVLKEQ